MFCKNRHCFLDSHSNLYILSKQHYNYSYIGYFTWTFIFTRYFIIVVTTWLTDVFTAAAEAILYTVLIVVTSLLTTVDNWGYGRSNEGKDSKGEVAVSRNHFKSNFIKK